MKKFLNFDNKILKRCACLPTWKHRVAKIISTKRETKEKLERRKMQNFTMQRTQK